MYLGIPSNSFMSMGSSNRHMLLDRQVLILIDCCLGYYDRINKAVFGFMTVLCFCDLRDQLCAGAADKEILHPSVSRKAENGAFPGTLPHLMVHWGSEGEAPAAQSGTQDF